MEISSAATARAAAIPYPSTFTEEERVEARRVYTVQRAELQREFAAELADEYLSGIPRGRRASIAESVFRMAWEEGHSSGYGEVENRYIDFADFALQVYRAATS
jgi:hypothetical protein